MGGQGNVMPGRVRCTECGLILRQNPHSNNGHCPRCAIKKRRRVLMLEYSGDGAGTASSARSWARA
jgi:hypothetical protein